ncbi:MAG: hypothetical protein LBS65_02975 [Desulfovibrio sp.]|nr:hypothetical protein [Desulfovibrio sp.]
MNKKKLVLNIIFSYIFILLTSLSSVAAFGNRDSGLHFTIISAVTIIIIVLFLRFSGFKTLGKAITCCLAGLFTMILFEAHSPDYFPSISTSSVVRDRFPNISTWEIDPCSHRSDFIGKFVGTYIYYDRDKKKFRYDGINLDNVNDISVIVFYSHPQPRKVGVYYDERSKTSVGATATDIIVALVDAETKICFEEQRLFAIPSSRITDILQADSSISHNSPTVREFIRKYFK